MQRLFILLLAVSLFTGCNEELMPVDEIQQHELELKAGENAVIESVTGSGHIHREYGEAGLVWRTFTIHATKKADGTVKGKYQINNHGANSSLKGDVICFNVIDENKAVLIVEWTKWDGEGDGPTWPLGYIIIEDNGSGNNSAPDRISLHHPEGWEWVEEDCNTLYDERSIPRYPIESGNLTVHNK